MKFIKLSALSLNVLILTTFVVPVSAATNDNLGNDTNANELYYLQGGKEQGAEWLKTTEINFMSSENDKPVSSIVTVQPFGQATAKKQLWFWQGQYAYESGSSTASAGVGWRKLSDDGKSIVGLNSFYDENINQHISRTSFGGEYFNKLTEYRANAYIPKSGDSDLSGTTFIRAVRGFDYEIGSGLAHAPWFHLYAAGFNYQNEYSSDDKGA